MIAVWSRRRNITDILLEGEHINLDIQENVRNIVQNLVQLISISLGRQLDGQLSISPLMEEM